MKIALWTHGYNGGIRSGIFDLFKSTAEKWLSHFAPIRCAALIEHGRDSDYWFWTVWFRSKDSCSCHSWGLWKYWFSLPQEYRNPSTRDWRDFRTGEFLPYETPDIIAPTYVWTCREKNSSINQLNTNLNLIYKPIMLDTVLSIVKCKFDPNFPWPLAWEIICYGDARLLKHLTFLSQPGSSYTKDRWPQGVSILPNLIPIVILNRKYAFILTNIG